VGLEAAEPEEGLPISLPLDDLARRGIITGLREAIQQGGLKAGVAFLRETTGRRRRESSGISTSRASSGGSGARGSRKTSLVVACVWKQALRCTISS
jgi:hypothetical protein